MYNKKLASETLDILWGNYLLLNNEIDLNFMSQETYDALKDRKLECRPFRIAAWVACQGFFISAWSLWEHHSRNKCLSLPAKIAQGTRESTVDWVNRSLLANTISFTDYEWFKAANRVRNVIAHSGGRIVASELAELPDPFKPELDKFAPAFPGIEAWRDGYLALEFSHAYDLMLRIDHYIKETIST